jgi:hypothetical protein
MDIATIGKLQKINFDQKNEFLENIEIAASFKEDHYTNLPLKAIVFSYSIREGKATNVNEKDLVSASRNDFITLGKYKIPIAFEP